jgi:2-oxo-4-hydroxy-4-carboxy-5-ureidoimidazoline decarboxylase
MLTLEQLNALPPFDAAEHLRACCGSSRWVEALVAARPFESLEAALAAADRIWWTTGPEDWNEALACHPRIGETASQTRVSDTARGWSVKEQEAVAASEESTRRQLDSAIQEYERKFGWIYVVFASGRGAQELLADLHTRMANDPERERMVTAREQLAITELRLRRMIST